MGKYSDLNFVTSETNCKLCPLGRFGNAAALDSAATGSNSCTSCGVGKYTASVGSTNGGCECKIFFHC